nr:endolytic transglycosylase MltG [Armatimonadota bacterium]
PQKMRAWVIIGSMVELEARQAPERPRIAGVIYNRLGKGMPLQIDATVAYGLKNKRRLLNSDYQIDHPYNTYKIKTLPPGPICSPGASAIKAAARPEKHGFLYYVAMPDGSHRFAKSYAEHLANVEISRRAFAVSRKS